MNNKHLYWIIPTSFFISLVLSSFIILFVQDKMLGKYDLYQCIYRNAETNSFNQNPIMIKKIQDECICFREYNYTDLLEVDCSQEEEEGKGNE